MSKKNKTIIKMPFLPYPISVHRMLLISVLVIVSGIAIFINGRINKFTNMSVTNITIGLITYSWGLYFILDLFGVTDKIRMIEQNQFQQDIQKSLFPHDRPIIKPSVDIQSQVTETVRQEEEKENALLLAEKSWKRKKHSQRNGYEKYFALVHIDKLLSYPIRVIGVLIQFLVGFQTLNTFIMQYGLYWLSEGILMLLLIIIGTVALVLLHRAKKHKWSCTPQFIKDFYEEFGLR